MVRALAQGRVDVREVRRVRRVRPEELPPDLAKSGAGPVRIGAAHDQCAGHVRVTRAELQRDLSPVAVAAHHRAIQTELADQYRDVVRDLGEGHETGGIGRASVTTTVGRDRAQAVLERGEQRLPHRVRNQPAVDQDHRYAGPVLLHVHRRPVHLDRATLVSVHGANPIPRRQSVARKRWSRRGLRRARDRTARSPAPAHARARARACVPRGWPARCRSRFFALGETPAWDDDQERKGRRLLLGKGAVLAHPLAHQLAAESDDDQQSGCRTRHYRDP